MMETLTTGRLAAGAGINIETVRFHERKVADLRRMRKSLASISAACDGHGTVAGCPIIHALEDGK